MFFFVKNNSISGIIFNCTQKHLGELPLISTHNMCFSEERLSQSYSVIRLLNSSVDTAFYL